MTETAPSAQAALPWRPETRRQGRLVPRRVVDDAIRCSDPGGIVLLEGPAGSGKSSAIAASAVVASGAVVASADALDMLRIDGLRCMAAAADKVVVLTASSRRPRVRLLGSGHDPVVVSADQLRFDTSELAQATRLADVRLTPSQLARVLILTDARPRLVSCFLGALPRASATTDAAIESSWCEISEDVRLRVIELVGAEPAARIASLLSWAPLITASLRRRLAGIERSAEQVLELLEAHGFAAQTERFGETITCVLPVFGSTSAVGAGWTDSVRAEYLRIGADVELATLLADAADWDGFRLLARERYPGLLRSGHRFAPVLARVPAEVMSADGWLIVVERMLAEEVGTFAPVRRLRKPSSAVPNHDRAWLQSSKVRLQLDSAAFSKAVAEASFLTRLLEQSDADDGTTADLWMQSALPPFFTGDLAQAVRRSTTAVGLASRHSRRHVEQFSGGVVALAHALRGSMSAATRAADELAARSIDGFSDSAWVVPARIATALVLTERDDLVAADSILDGIRESRLGSFWALYAVAVGRRALAARQEGAAVGLDRLRVIEQFAGTAPASNRHRGMLAAVTALLQLSIGRADDAAEGLRPFDDGRESSMLPTALIHLARGDAQSANALAEHWTSRNSAPVTLVAAATVRTLAVGGATADATARRAALARRCGLENFSALIRSIGSR